MNIQIECVEEIFNIIFIIQLVLTLDDSFLRGHAKEIVNAGCEK